jgi:hypothetical protein
MGNRKAAEALCLEIINDIIPDGNNKRAYEKLFASMSDEDFDKFISDLESEKKKLAVIAPNFGKVRLEFKRNLQIGKKLGHRFYKRIWIPAEDGARGYLTPIPHLVIDAPIRRQAQLLSKKLSVAKDSHTVDELTGQAAGDSQAAKISAPEVNVLAGMGLDNSLLELVKVRGGDEGAFNAYTTLLDHTGEASLAQIDPHSTGVQSTQALDVYLKAAHINSTLLK